MASVIEEAVIRILPSFKDFKPELEAKLKEFTEGEKAEIKVKLQVDARTLHNSIKDSLAGITNTASTVKLRAEFDHAQMKRDFTTAIGRATESAASTTAAAKVRIDVNQQSLKASLQTGIREAVRQVNTATGEGVKVKVEPIIDRRKLDAQLAELSKRTITVKVRYDVESAPVGLRAAGGGGSGIGTGPEAGRRGGQKGGSSFGRIAAEFFNALPGVGGIGPHAAEALVAGIVAGAPAIAAAVQGAVMGGLAAGVFATGITIAAQDQQVRNAAGVMGASLMGTLSGAAAPFKTELLSLFPQISTDVKRLAPQLYSIFGALAPSLSTLERGLVGGIQNALQPEAARNTAEFIDTIATKLPAMGAAAGRFVTALTDPAAAHFFTQLIDFVDAAVVDAGKLVAWLGKINETLTKAGVWAVVGATLKTLVSTISAAAAAIGAVFGGLSAVFGPGLTASIVAVGAAFLLLGSRASVAAAESTSSWALARTSFLAYASAVAKGAGPIGAAQLTGNVLQGVSGGSALRARLASGAINASSVAAIIGGSALSSSGYPVLGGGVTGAGLGALLGFQAGGPAGAAVGAVGGGALGVAGAYSQQQSAAADQLKSSIRQLGDEFAKTGTISQSLYQNLALSNDALASLVNNQAKYGVSLNDIVKAQASGDPKQFDKLIKAAQKGAATNADDQWWVKGAAVFGSAFTGFAAKKYAESQDPVVQALHQLAAAAKAAGPPTPPPFVQPWQGTTFEKYQQLITGATPAGIPSPFTASNGQNMVGEAQTIQAVVEQYHSYLLASRAVDDARYQQQQTLQQTSIANEAALHGIAQAEHGVAQAHFATEMAQRSLTEARKEAIQNLVELKRQIRDIGDNEEQLKINLVQANLAEQQTRGLDPDSLARREAVLNAHKAANALADFQADEPTLRAKARLAEQQGVAGSTPVLQAQNALAESQRNETEQARNVKLARENYNNTVEASRRQNQLASRAVEDANYALGDQARQLGIVEAATHLTTDAVKKLYDGAQKLNDTFALDITDNGTAFQAFGAIGDLYKGLSQLAAQYGITIPGWNDTWTFAPPPDTSIPARRGGLRAGPTFAADGGLIDGYSPHDKADNLLSWVTAGEFVVNAAQTRKHRMLLESINAGHYADGGFVLPLDKAIDKWSGPIKAQLQALSGITGGSGGNIGAVQSWLRTTVDPLPYVFGATGPSQYDCSGLVGEVWARLTGNKDYQRYFVTGNERQFLSAHGFRDGTGTFTVGFSGEHTMGTLGGLPFEAANPRSGIHIGSGTSDVTKFPNVMYLPQLGDQFVGGSGYPPSVDKVSVGGVWGQFLRKILANAKTLADQRASGGDTGLPSGGVEAWRGAVIQALSANNLATSPDMVGAVLRQIQTESSGNPGAIQQVHDVNWPNNRARGLMQVIPPTFEHYKFPGHGDPFNGLDSLLAALNYAKHRYGADLTGVLGHGHGYDQGGWLHDVGVNTTGRPEAVLNPDESRAYVQHAQAVSGSGGEIRLDDYSIARLAQALSTRPIGVHMDGRKVADAVVPHLERRF